MTLSQVMDKPYFKRKNMPDWLTIDNNEYVISMKTYNPISLKEEDVLAIDWEYYIPNDNNGAA